MITSDDLLHTLAVPTRPLLDALAAELDSSRTTPSEVFGAVYRALMNSVIAEEVDNRPIEQRIVGRKVRVVTNDFVGVITSSAKYPGEDNTEIVVAGPTDTPGRYHNYATYIEGPDVLARTDAPGESYLVILDE